MRSEGYDAVQSHVYLSFSPWCCILCGEHMDEKQSFLDHIARCIPPELEYTVTEAMIRYHTMYTHPAARVDHFGKFVLFVICTTW